MLGLDAVVETPDDTASESADSTDLIVARNRMTLDRFDFNTLKCVTTPVRHETAQAALRFLFESNSWHDDLDLLRRKVRLWKESIYDNDWESEAIKLRASNPNRWTYAKLGKHLGVGRVQVRALFVTD